MSNCTKKLSLKRINYRSLFLFLIISTLLPQNINALDLKSFNDVQESSYSISVQSRSGSPLILEFKISYQEDLIDSFSVKTPVSYSIMNIGETNIGKINIGTEEGAEPVQTGEDAEILNNGLNQEESTDDNDKKEDILYWGLFNDPGIYPVTLEIVLNEDQLNGDEGTENSIWFKELEIGFSDFIWGRDNYQFSNKESKYWGITPYSKTLFPWIESRFDSISIEDKILLLNSAYHIFTGRVGRCYAFSASKALYKRYPEKLPSYYKHVYSVRETNRQVQQKMNFLQNDIMFDHFIIGEYDVSREQSLDALRREIEKITNHISNGKLVPVGFWNSERHHSLLVYGYIKDLADNKLTLIAANNWGTNHQENMVSEAAVQLEINLEPSYTGERICWVDAPYSNYDYAEHLFAVEVKEDYEFNNSDIENLLATKYTELINRESALLIIEQANSMTLKNSLGEILDESSLDASGEHMLYDYRQVSDTYIFEFPTWQSYSLSFTPMEVYGDGGEDFKPDCYIHYVTVNPEDYNSTISYSITPENFKSNNPHELYINNRGTEVELREVDMTSSGNEQSDN